MIIEILLISGLFLVLGFLIFKSKNDSDIIEKYMKSDNKAVDLYEHSDSNSTNEEPVAEESVEEPVEEPVAKESVVEESVEEPVAVVDVPVKPKRARNTKGKFIADDPSTPDVNEAWEDGKAPEKKEKSNTKKKPTQRKPRKPRLKVSK